MVWPDLWILLAIAWMILPFALVFLVLPPLDEGLAVACDDVVDIVSESCSSLYGIIVSRRLHWISLVYTHPFHQSFSELRLRTANLDSTSFAHLHKLIP